MFSYYGSKSKMIKFYPKPECDKIIEPFAGSARYALEYWEKDVLLVDNYDKIIRIWHYLQKASVKDIESLPELTYKQSLDDYKYLSDDERLLMGFMVARGVRRPQKIVQKFSNIDIDKRRIIKNLHKIKHWKIELGDYKKIENQKATWFVDAPYQIGGELYNTCERDSLIDFNFLSEWCKNRIGQVIVCENTKASWLPFSPLRENKGAYSKTTESIWINNI